MGPAKGGYPGHAALQVVVSARVAEKARCPNRKRLRDAAEARRPLGVFSVEPELECRPPCWTAATEAQQGDTPQAQVNGDSATARRILLFTLSPPALSSAANLRSASRVLLGCPFEKV